MVTPTTHTHTLCHTHTFNLTTETESRSESFIHIRVKWGVHPEMVKQVGNKAVNKTDSNISSPTDYQKRKEVEDRLVFKR